MSRTFLLVCYLLIFLPNVHITFANDVTCLKEGEDSTCETIQDDSQPQRTASGDDPNPYKPGSNDRSNQADRDLTESEADATTKKSDKDVFLDMIGQEMEASKQMIRLQDERISLLERLRQRVLEDNEFYTKDRDALEAFLRPMEEKVMRSSCGDSKHEDSSFDSHFAEKYLERAQAAVGMDVLFIQLRGAILGRAMNEGYSDLVSVPCTALSNGSLVFVDPLKPATVFTFDTGHATPIERLKVVNYPSDLIFTVDRNGEIRIHNYSVFFRYSRIAGRAKTPQEADGEGDRSPLTVLVTTEKVIEAPAQDSELLSLASTFVGRTEKLAFGYRSGRLMMMDRYGETSDMVNLTFPVEAIAWRSPLLAVVQDATVEFVRVSNSRVHTNTCQAPFGQKLGTVEYDLFATGMVFAGTKSGHILVFDPRAQAQSTVSSRKSSSRTVCRLMYKLDLNQFLENPGNGEAPKLGSLRGYLVATLRDKLVVFNITAQKSMPEVVLVESVSPPANGSPTIAVAKVGYGRHAHTCLVVGNHSNDYGFGLYEPLLPYYIPEKVDFVGYFRAPMMVVVLVIAFGYNFVGKGRKNPRSSIEHMRRQAPFGTSYGGRDTSLEQEMDAYLRHAEHRSSGRAASKLKKSASPRKNRKIF